MDSGVMQQPLLPISKQDAGLSNEIWLMILHLLYQSGPAALTPVARLSRRFNQLAAPLICRKITFKKSSQLRSLNLLLKKKHSLLKQCTRAFEFPDNAGHGWALWGVVSVYIEKCQGLEYFIWSNDGRDMPDGLLKSLALCSPNLRLQLKVVISEPSHMLLRPLFPLDKLDSLDVKFRRVDESEDEIQLLAEALVDCVRLRSLSITPDEDGENFYFPTLISTLPAVRELKLMRYDWPSLSTAAQDFWDFSSVETLSLVDVPLFQLYRNNNSRPYQFSSLRTLVLGSTVDTTLDIEECLETERALDHLWKNAPGLESLTLYKLPFSLWPPVSFKYFGSTLLELNLLDPGSDEGDSWIPPDNTYIDLGDLKALQAACNRLEKLHVPISLEENQGNDELTNILSKWQSLQEIRIESEYHLGFDGNGWRWNNVPTHTVSFRIAKQFVTSVVDKKEGFTIRNMVVLTSGQYQLGGQIYFRKYEYNGSKFGYKEYSGYPHGIDEVTFVYGLHEKDPIEDGELGSRASKCYGIEP